MPCGSGARSIGAHQCRSTSQCSLRMLPQLSKVASRAPTGDQCRSSRSRALGFATAQLDWLLGHEIESLSHIRSHAKLRVAHRLCGPGLGNGAYRIDLCGGGSPSVRRAGEATRYQEGRRVRRTQSGQHLRVPSASARSPHGDGRAGLDFVRSEGKKSDETLST
jgi:hypothetical protein